MDTSQAQQWMVHLRSIGQRRDTGDVVLGAGALDEPFGLAVSDQHGGAAGSEAARARERVPWGEVGLWWAVVDRSVNVDALIAEPTEGSLLPQGLYRAIEVWTEADLCGLHALWRLARERGRDDWQARCECVRAWHLEHTQPDNATNRPWALHVFLELWLRRGDVDGRMYAETLLHNCMSMTGEPDALSAMILQDAARELERASAR